MSQQEAKATLQVRDQLFTEIALRGSVISDEVIAKGWSAVDEMAQFGISRALPAVLVERKLATKDDVKAVLRDIEMVSVRCTRCHKGVPLRGVDSDDRVRCGRCETVLQLSLREDAEADGLPIEERLVAEAVSSAGVTDREAPIGGRREAGRGRRDPTLFPGEAAASTASAPAPASPRRAAAARGGVAHGDGADVGAPGGADPSGEKATPKSYVADPCSGHIVRNAITRFEIGPVLHSGPFGRLYRAKFADLQKKGTFVLKVLSQECVGDVDVVDRFEKALAEWNTGAEKALRASHSFQCENGIRYVVRSFFREPYVSLADFRLTDPEHKARVIQRVTSLVAELHGAGLVHGNLKPSNVFLKNDGTLKKAYLVDPALTRLIPGDNELARWRLLLRSARYRAPEQIEGRSPRMPTDVYSLGWSIYAVLAERPPFHGIPPVEMLNRHREGPCQELPSEHAKWQELVDHMTAVRPEERPKNAIEVLSAVNGIIAGKSYKAPPLTPREDVVSKGPLGRSGKRQKGHKQPERRFVAGPAALLVVLAWVGWCLFNWHSAVAEQTAHGRQERLYVGLVEKSFRGTRSAALANPDQARELWTRFLEMFPDSHLKKQAEAEIAKLGAR